MGNPASRHRPCCTWKKLRCDQWCLGAAHQCCDAFAIAARGIPEMPRRNPGDAMEAAHEIRQVGETGLQRNVGYRAFLAGEHARGPAQACAQQILVRRDPDHTREHAQEMPRAQAGLRRGCFEVDVLVRVLVEPQRALDGTASVARVPPQRGATVAACERQVTTDQEKTGFIHAEIVPAFGSRLREFAQHHQFRQRRQSTRAPLLGFRIETRGEFGRELE